MWVYFTDDFLRQKKKNKFFFLNKGLGIFEKG